MNSPTLFSHLSTASQLCSHCEKILGVEENKAAVEDLSKDWGDCGFARLSPLSILKETAETCELCSLVWKPVFNNDVLNSWYLRDVQDPLVEIRIRAYDGLKAPGSLDQRPSDLAGKDTPYTLLYTYTFLRGATDLQRHIRKDAPHVAKAKLIDGLHKVARTALKYAELGPAGTLDSFMPKSMQSDDYDHESDNSDPGDAYNGTMYPGVADKRYWNFIAHGNRIFQMAQLPFGYNGNIADMGSSAAFVRARQWLDACRCFDPVLDVAAQNKQNFREGIDLLDLEADYTTLKVTRDYEPLKHGILSPNLDHINTSFVDNREHKILQYGMELVNLRNAQSLLGPAPRTELPTRVLDISCSDKPPTFIRLHISKAGDNRPYAALSYVWGGPQVHQTTKATILDMIGGIQVASLPQSLQDAVNTTWSIGLRFLWIDSLCIIQDDEFDKGKEIQKMHRIYRDATVTISASMSSTCRAGFLKSTGRLSAPKQGFKCIDLPYFQAEYKNAICRLETDVQDRLDGNSDGWPKEYANPTNSTRRDLYENLESIESTNIDPIDLRAWTMQERALSRRTLIFGQEGLAWECGCMKSLHGLQSTFKSFHIQRDPGDLLDEWARLVEQYMTRNITMQADRLRAIQGISDALKASPLLPARSWSREDWNASSPPKGYTSETHFGRYLSGLWENGLTSQLLWKVHVETVAYESHGNPSRIKKRDHSLAILPGKAHLPGIIPSWSWASVSYPVALLRNIHTAPPWDDGLCPPLPSFKEYEVAYMKEHDIRSRIALRMYAVRSGYEDIVESRAENLQRMRRVMAQVIDIFEDPAEVGRSGSLTRINLLARCEPVCIFDQSIVKKVMENQEKHLYLDRVKELVEDLEWSGLLEYFQSKWLLQIPFWEEGKFPKNSYEFFQQDFNYLSGLILEEIPGGCFRRVGMFGDDGYGMRVKHMFNALEDERRKATYAEYTPPPMPPKVWQEERTEKVYSRPVEGWLDALFSDTGKTRVTQKVGWIHAIPREEWKETHFHKEVKDGRIDLIQRRQITLV